MNILLKWTVMLALCVGTAYGQVPASNDTSDGNLNTGIGTNALNGPVAENPGLSNTAIGSNTLYDNTTGSFNTAVGSSALMLNSSGNYNTASGFEALARNTTGIYNSASGIDALLFNTTGGENTASGAYALYSNTTGTYNTASGAYALQNNTTANGNTASGYQALYSNTTGYQNTATGLSALNFNTTGTYNTAFGNYALFSNATGNNNTAIGTSSFSSDVTGSNNIGVGYSAGLNVTTGSNNIEIGDQGEPTDGVAANSGVIRIGTKGSQKEVYIAGIENSKITGSVVYVTTTGRLGVLASSERYKTAIEPMGVNTEKLQQLRPVSFHLKTEPNGALQYGLIAEEVDKVYPALVIRDEAGKIQGVRYDELAPMLLNEVQKQEQRIDAQAKTNADQAAEIRDLRQQLAGIQAALVKLQPKDQLVAQR